MAKTPPRNIEAAIQRAVVHWMKEHHPAIMMQATLNENSHHCMDMGCTAGIPDLLLFLPGPQDGLLHIFFLELKTKKGKLSDSQIAWALTRPRSHNVTYGVAYGYTEAIQAIQSWVDNLSSTAPTATPGAKTLTSCCLTSSQ